MPDQDLIDQNNPDPKLRMRPVVGIEIFASERRAGPDGWKGNLYVPDSGHTWNARLQPVDQGRLSVSVCGPFGFLCSQEIWQRTR